MISKFLTVFILTFFISLSLAAVPEKSCKAAVSGILKDQIAEITVCTKSLKFKNAKEKKQKFNCIMKCVGINFKMLTPEGLMDRETLDKYVENNVPPSLVERATGLINKCYDVVFGKLDPNDEFCKTYEPLTKCAMDAVPKFCD